MNVIDLPQPTPCPSCNARFDAVTGTVDDSSLPPIAGDFSVCCYCGKILQFSGDRNKPFVVATRAMLEKLFKDDQTFFFKLMLAQRTITIELINK
jgi:hypothetical protein